MDLFTKLLMKQGGAPYLPNRLTGSAFSATQIASGFSGSYDVTTNVNRIYWAAPNASALHGGTVWSAWIKGTAATIKLPNGLNAGAILVSVDGGAYSTCSNAADVYTLFTGLSDVSHFVSVRTGTAYGTANVYADKTGGNILNITGASPYVDLPSSFAISSNATSIFSQLGGGVANTANFYPPLSTYNALTGNPSNTGALVLNGNFQKLNVSLTGVGGDYGCWVSVNGAAPTRYASVASVGNANAMSIAVSEGTKKYYVWPSRACSVFSASGDGVASVNTGLTQLHQFGDSITYGLTDRGNVDTFAIGASIGYAPLTLGISGLTTVGLDTNISDWLTKTPVTTNDVAVLAIGRNDVGGSFSAPVIAAYTSILNKLIAKGYGKILVRGILPNGDLSTTWPLENASIQSCIATVGNPKLIFVDTSTCPAYSTEGGDNTHPNTAGYVTIADYLLPKYRTALGI